MKFGLFYEMPVPVTDLSLGRYTEQELYEAVTRQVVAAEELGFEYFWVPEHHHNVDFSHIPAPDILLTHVAALTRKIRIGPAVVLLPINHPVMVAERYATIDILSGGRLEMGVGRGAYGGWLDLFAPGKLKSLDETRDIFYEGIEVIRKAWGPGPFTHQGQYFQIQEPIDVVPKPLQKPHPRFHAACTGPDSIEIYSGMGINAQIISSFTPVSKVEDQVKRFRSAWAEGLKKPNTLATTNEGEFSCLVNTYCAPTRRQALDELRPYWDWFMARMTAFYTPDRVRRQQGRVPYAGAVNRQLDFDTAVSEGCICVGSPNDCLQYISTLQRFGVDTTLTHFQIGPLPFEKTLKSIQLFGKEVVPHFRRPG